MGVVLGTMTTVVVNGTDSGFQSVNWNINRQPNRLWQLGDWVPYRTQVGTTVTVSITAYAGALGTQSLRASTSCEISPASRTITINAETCDVGAIYETWDNMFITSFSYSKGDPIGFGTESWSFQKWLESGVAGDYIVNIPEPTYIVQGASEGSRSGTFTDLDDTGLVFYPGDQGQLVTGSQGSVSAGFPGIGNADDITLGIVQQIGGGLLEAGGKIGQSNATIPHQPLYIG